MKYISKTFIILISLLFILSSLNCKKDAVKYKRELIKDNGMLFSSSEIKKLEEKITSIRNNTSVDIFIQTIESLDGQDLKEYALNISKNEKIGIEGINNGIILLIAKQDKKIRMSNGFGIEWIINDEKSSQIIKDAVLYFREGDFFHGVYYMLEQIEKCVSPLDWKVYKNIFPNVDNTYDNKIVSFINNGNREEMKYSILEDSVEQFNDDFYILVKLKNNEEYKLHYTKYMSADINDIKSQPSVTIYARIKDFRAKKLELLGIVKP